MFLGRGSIRKQRQLVLCGTGNRSGKSFNIPWSCIFKWGLCYAKSLSGKVLRAMRQLWQLLKDVEPPLHISFNLFDSLLASVLNYGSEVGVSCMLSTLKECTENLQIYVKDQMTKF